MRTKDILHSLRSAGLTQTQIARLTGISQPRLSRWEAGNVPKAADESLVLAEVHRQVVLRELEVRPKAAA